MIDDDVLRDLTVAAMTTRRFEDTHAADTTEHRKAWADLLAWVERCQANGTPMAIDNEWPSDRYADGVDALFGGDFLAQFEESGQSDLEAKTRHVRDAAFWGAPVGTPLPLPKKPDADVPDIPFRRIRPRQISLPPDERQKEYHRPESLVQIAPVITTLADLSPAYQAYVNNDGDSDNPGHLMVRFKHDKKRKPKTITVSEREVADHVVDYVAEATDEDMEKGEQWYADAHKFAVSLSKKYSTEDRPLSVEMVAGVISALSPHNTWTSNQLMAERLIGQWADDDFGGKPIDEAKISTHAGIHTYVKDAIEILRTGGDMDSLTGPKRRSFANNIIDPSNSYDVTIDGWIAGLLDRIGKDYTESDASAWLRQRKEKNKQVQIDGAGYFIMADAFRAATDRINAVRGDKPPLLPQQVQAIYWVKAKREGDKMWPGEKSINIEDSDWPYTNPHLDPTDGAQTDPDFFDAYTLIEVGDTKMPSAWQTYLTPGKPKRAKDNPRALEIMRLILAGEIKSLLGEFEEVARSQATKTRHVRDAAFWGAPVGTPLPLPKKPLDPMDDRPALETIDFAPPMPYDPQALRPANLNGAETLEYALPDQTVQDWADLEGSGDHDDGRLEMAAVLAFQQIDKRHQGRIFKNTDEIDNFVTEVLDRAGYRDRAVSINEDKGQLGKNVEAGVSRGMTETLPGDHPLHGAVIPCLIYRKRGVSEFVLLHEIAHIIEGTWKDDEGDGGHNITWWNTFGALLAQDRMDFARNLLQVFGYAFTDGGALR